MASNRRVFYATHLFGLAPFQTTSYTSVHGAQNIGVNTNFTLEPVQELGQISIYQLVEMIPEIEATAEKDLDGYPLMYHLSTQGALDGSLIGRSNQRCQLAMSVYGDTQKSASGTPTSAITCSGMYISQHGFTLGTDAVFRESCSWVGNDKIARTTGFDYQPNFLNTDTPLALAGSGGVQIRRDIIFHPILGTGDPSYSKETATSLDANNQLNAFLTILPPDIPGISSSGTNDIDSTGQYGAHVTSINPSVNFGRDAVLELGRKQPYFRFVNFPVQVTCEISTIATQADTINASEQGLDGLGNNLVARTIKIRVREGTFINLGTQNKLQSVSFQGGGTDGGQVTTTYSYVTYNDWNISHPQDPSNFPYPY